MTEPFHESHCKSFDGLKCDCPASAVSDTPISRLQMWEKGTHPDVGYTAGSNAFADDVVALLRSFSDVTRERDKYAREFSLAERDKLTMHQAIEGWKAKERERVVGVEPKCPTCGGSGTVYDLTRGSEGGPETCPTCFSEGDAPLQMRDALTKEET